MGILIYIIIFLVIIAFSFRTTIAKANMGSKLKRQVDDHELLSLNSWMKAEEMSTPKLDILEKLRSKALPNAENNANVVFPLGLDFEEAAPMTQNCYNCGAVISKSLAICNFCGNHQSLKAVEAHCAAFLLDLEEDFTASTPFKVRFLEASIYAVPLLFFGSLETLLVINMGLGACANLFVGLAATVVIGTVWNSICQKIIDKEKNQRFEQMFASRIVGLLTQLNLRPIEMLSIADSRFEKKSDLLKQIHRRF